MEETMEKKIVINVLPQSPEAWLFIAIAVVGACFFLCLGFGRTKGNIDVERERTRRIEKLMEAGYTNAVIEEIKRDLNNG
jgi:hypothetical protein